MNNVTSAVIAFKIFGSTKNAFVDVDARYFMQISAANTIVKTVSAVSIERPLAAGSLVSSMQKATYQ